LQAFSLVLDPQENPLEYRRLLNAGASSFKEDKRLKASVEGILYWVQGETPFLLLGKESPFKKGGNSVCEMGGSVELEAPNLPETFLKCKFERTSRRNCP